VAALKFAPAALAAALLLVVSPLHAQEAPVFLDPSHWSGDALRRLGTMGLLPPAADPAMAPLTLRHLRRTLVHAAARGDSLLRPAEASLAREYLARLDAESATTRGIQRAWVAAGALGASGEARAGTGMVMDVDWTGAEPLRDIAGPVVQAGAAAASNRFSAAFAGAYSENRLLVHAASLGAAVGPVDLWIGRQRLHYGLGRSGGVILGSGTGPATDLSHRIHYTFEGVGVHLREPFDFPGFLRILGPARVEAVLGRLPRSGAVERPYVAFGRLSGHPFSDRITLGVNRGAVFGGGDAPLSPRNLFGLLVGLHNDEFENQVFSTILRLRPPLGALALEAFVEWGMDDTAGAVRDVPGIVAGLDVGAIPGLPEVGVGVEVTRFAPSCCGNPIWYRHWYFTDNWASDGRLFAHPLGGQGSEVMLHTSVDMPGRGLLVRGRALRRNRGPENLLSPGREGRTVGGAISVEYGHGPLRLRLNASGEDGAGWRTGRLTALLTRSFRAASPE
jgi:hypothetical protein